MSAAAIIRNARADGLSLSLTPHGTVKFKGPQRAVVKWTPILKRHKPEILRLLQAAAEPVAAWDELDWRAHFDERAGVAEFDGCLPRREAESMAYRSCVSEWMCQNVQTSEPGECAWCKRGDLAGRPVLPYGDENSGHSWLHGECWGAWWEHRRQDAIAALADFGIIHEGRQPA